MREKTVSEQVTEGLRIERNRLLTQTDYTQMPDYIALHPTMTEAWQLYRQALRDLPETVDLNNVVWPEKPQVQQ